MRKPPKTHFITTLLVEGKFPFPLDMLRYDNCWPRDSESAAEIRRSIEREHGPGEPGYKVRLYRAADQLLPPTFDRWRSFSWVVTEVNGEPVRYLDGRVINHG